MAKPYNHNLDSMLDACGVTAEEVKTITQKLTAMDGDFNIEKTSQAVEQLEKIMTQKNRRVFCIILLDLYQERHDSSEAAEEKIELASDLMKMLKEKLSSFIDANSSEDCEECDGDCENCDTEQSPKMKAMEDFMSKGVRGNN